MGCFATEKTSVMVTAFVVTQAILVMHWAAVKNMANACADSTQIVRKKTICAIWTRTYVFCAQTALHVMDRLTAMTTIHALPTYAQPAGYVCMNTTKALVMTG
jgi:hypothetical protein